MAESDASRLDDWVEVRDGIAPVDPVCLPDAALGPQPCVLEALPYRKDDMTSGYRPEYVRLSDDYGYAVAASTFAAPAAPGLGHRRIP